MSEVEETPRSELQRFFDELDAEYERTGAKDAPGLSLDDIVEAIRAVRGD